MPSFRASLASFVIQWKFSDLKHASDQGVLQHIKDTWREANAQVIVPSQVNAVEEEVGGCQVFHVAPKEKVETKKVVVYWHGGECSWNGASMAMQD